MARYECTHCETTFDRDEPRCPTCARKSTVREIGAGAEVEELARAGARPPDVRRGLRVLGVIVLLGGWAGLAALLARAMSGGLSTVFMLLVASAVFVAGVVPVLLWMRRVESPAVDRGSGKWR
jgi:hypothetical protein